MVIHTERSISTVPLCNSHRNTLRLLKRRDGTHHDDVVSVSQVFPEVSVPRTDGRGDLLFCYLFSTLGDLKFFLPVTDAVFQAEM